jgi:hypothetical protein
LLQCMHTPSFGWCFICFHLSSKQEQVSFS